MKLLVLKLCALIAMCDGVLTVLWALQVPQFLDFISQNSAYLPGQPEAFQYELVAWIAGGVIVALLGLYGLFPKVKHKKRRAREIVFEGDHGEVVIQLDSVQRALTNVIGRMPEVKRVLVRVEPDDDGRRAMINADVVIYSQGDVRARQTANDVSEYIAQSAIHILGLEDLATIKLNVVGIEVNPKQASKQIRNEYHQRLEAQKRPKLEYQPVPASPTPVADQYEEARASIRANAATVAPAPAPESVPAHEHIADTESTASHRFTWEESRDDEGNLVIEAEKHHDSLALNENEGVFNESGFASTERDETALGEEDIPVAAEEMPNIVDEESATATAEDGEAKKRGWF